MLLHALSHLHALSFQHLFVALDACMDLAQLLADVIVTLAIPASCVTLRFAHHAAMALVLLQEFARAKLGGRA